MGLLPDIKLGEDASKSDFTIDDHRSTFPMKGRNGNQIVKGQHRVTKQEVAIKIIPKEDKSVSEIEDIRETIKMYEQAMHFNVVRLEDHFEEKNKFYLCLELHSGPTLYRYIQENLCCSI